MSQCELPFVFIYFTDWSRISGIFSFASLSTGSGVPEGDAGGAGGAVLSLGCVTMGGKVRRVSPSIILSKNESIR